MTVRSNRLPARFFATFAAMAMVAAACTGGDSAIEAGLDDPEEPAPTDSTGIEDENSDIDDRGEPATDESGDESADDGSEATEPADDGEAAALRPCPLGALDAVDEPVEVTMWYGLPDALGSELQALADRYNGSQDRVVVTIENQVDYESTIDSYQQLEVDQRPELLLAPEFAVQGFAESDTFVPAQSCVDAAGLDTSTFLPRALDTYSFGSTLWALPFNVSRPACSKRGTT